VLNGCDWPEGRALSELADALPARGLKTLKVSEMPVGGTLPAALFEKCAESETTTLTLGKLGLTGSIPASVGKCTKLRYLTLKENQLGGAVPASELAKTNMSTLQLQKNEALTITASGKKELEYARPKLNEGTSSYWPKVVDK
tara:strand:+ start:212 stop:640 length:429 start_codon:yes stop_codon:yes gene_type:complete